MKGASSKDGKMHGNVQMISRYDASKGQGQKPKAEGGDSGGAHEPSGHDEIKQVVAEHGPATHVEIEHNLETGEHHVHSKHEDGHEHHSVHGSHAEAHAAGAHLGGVTDSNELQEAHTGMQEEDTLHEAGHRRSIEKNSHRGQAGEGFMPEHAMS